jgi:hypothetical protein
MSAFRHDIRSMKEPMPWLDNVLVWAVLVLEFASRVLMWAAIIGLLVDVIVGDRPQGQIAAGTAVLALFGNWFISYISQPYGTSHEEPPCDF